MSTVLFTKCSFNKTNPNGSCFQDSTVKKIAKYTNGNDLNEIKKETKCVDDECILEKVKIPTEVKDQIIRETFKPTAGSFDHNYWLNNTEIDNCMSQLRALFPGFSHGFIHMSDMKSFPPSNLHSFDYKVLSCNDIDFGNEFKHALITPNDKSFVSQLSTYDNKPLTSYGIVFNTDSSSGSGQHWFSVFISTDQRDPDNLSQPWIRIEMFNSSGNSISSSIFNNFWEKTAIDIAMKTGYKCTFEQITTIQHQKDDTGNCGSYSLFYIYSRLNKVHPSEFNNPNRLVTDFAMQKFRQVCFQLESKK